MDALGRLTRLEEHYRQDGSLEAHRNAVDNSPFFDLGAAPGESIGEDSTPEVPLVIQNAIHNIENPKTRSLLLSNVFCHLRLINTCFFNNERCIKAINSATAEIESLQKVQEIELPRGPIVPKDLAKDLIESKRAMTPSSHPLVFGSGLSKVFARVLWLSSIRRF